MKQGRKAHQKHTYNKGDEVLLKNAWKTKISQDAYQDLYVITAVRNNGTVKARKDQVTNIFSIYSITTYNESMVKSQTPLTFLILLHRRNKCSSTMEQYEIHKYIQP